MNDFWVCWHRPDRDSQSPHSPWVRVLSGSSERETLTLANEAKLGDGEILVLPADADPNSPVHLRNPTGWHNDGTAGRKTEAVAVTRGKFGRRGR